MCFATLRIVRWSFTEELKIQKQEQEEALFFASLEKIFIEERIYKDPEFENAKNMDEAISHIDLSFRAVQAPIYP